MAVLPLVLVANPHGPVFVHIHPARRHDVDRFRRDDVDRAGSHDVIVVVVIVPARRADGSADRSPERTTHDRTVAAPHVVPDDDARRGA
jgi:hypothetical protein